ncbi:MAG: hypothetical protein LBK83_07025 [Treponema sp.]|jgi:hypothetical protein|nr:hypothetical protein [Treponema sp.]
MPKETIRKPEMGLTFEKVWAMFQETDRKMKEIASKGVKDFAVKSGFFVLEQSGDTIRISVPEGFKPREW